MCGIAGFVATEPSGAVAVDRLQQINAAMQNRGPDGEGFWYSDDASIALAHRRLAVIDLSDQAAQPMVDASGDFVISYNGEIYNYRELRDHCEQRGYVFRTHSDTEVLLALYAYYGEAMLGKLRGMFAFAISDVKQRQVMLARDPLGIKPLYYAHAQGGYYFASSLTALDQAGIVDWQQVSASALGSFYLSGSVAEPDTWYRQAKLLPAGSYCLYKVGSGASVVTQSYWSLPMAASMPANTAEEDATKVREAVTGSVRAHMVADVPVGLFLSAGIDSGVLASLMHSMSDKPVIAITLRFAEYENTLQDETPIAAELARRFGMQHCVYTLSREEFLAELPAFFAAMEQPTIDALNVWFVAKAARQQGLKVVLSGIGGDELFGGYPSFKRIPRLLKFWRCLSIIPFAQPVVGRLLGWLMQHRSPKWRSLPDYAGTVPSAYRLQRALFLPDELSAEFAELAQAGGTDVNGIVAPVGWAESGDESRSKSIDTRLQIAGLETRFYLRNQLLRDADWAGMAHSIEIRTPLVDHCLWEQLNSVSPGYRFRAGKAALLGLLSARERELLANRPKTGFTLPMREWLQSALHGVGAESAAAFEDNTHWSRVYAHHVISRFKGSQTGALQRNG